MNRPTRSRLGLLCFGTVLAFLLIEASLRCAGWLYAEWRLPRHVAPGNNGLVRVLCEGDSFTFGIGAPKGQSYPEQLQSLFDARRPGQVQVVNGGVPGTNSAVIFRHLREDLDKYHSDFVIVMAGTNDNSNFEESSYYMFLPGWRSRVARLDAVLSNLRTYKLIKRALTYGAEAAPTAAPRHDPDPRSPEAALALRQAADLYGEVKLTEALAVLAKASQKHPDDPALSLRTGLILLHGIGDNARAAERFHRTLELDPHNVTVQIDLFVSYQRLGDREKMQEALVELHRLDPDPLWTQMLRYGIASNGDLGPFERVLAYDLKQIADYCRGRGVQAVFQTYADPGWRNDAIVASAHAAGVLLIDNEHLFPAKDTALYHVQDGHLNGSGYGLMAKNAYDHIEPLISDLLKKGPKIVRESD